MKHTVLFTADIHGNEVQYSKLVDFAITISADSLIIGGDIAPKRGGRERLISEQRSFLSNRFPELLRPFKEEQPDSRIYVMMGNDDCDCNLDILERYENRLFNQIHNRRFHLTKDFDIVGYSFVPITPFMLKDWEKFDFSEVSSDLAAQYARRKSWNYRLEGFKSTLKGWRKFHFIETTEADESIQKDLGRSLFTENPERTVYVFHTPPDDTNLDQRYDNAHVGSMAVRLFIEEHQPYLTLHGHIHETVDVSGTFKDRIDNTLCLSVGNHNLGNYEPNDLSVLTFNLYDIRRAERRIV